MHDNYIFGAGQTNIHPLGLALLAVIGIFILVLPRKYVLLPFLLGAICFPFGEQVVVGGLHFPMLRLLLIVAWSRLILGIISGRDSVKLSAPIDKALILYFLVSAFAFILLWHSTGAFIDRMGFLYNAFGVYFLLRFQIRDWDDVSRTIRFFVFIAAVLTVFSVIEQVTARNLFGLLGGSLVPAIREGRLRSQGPFETSILMGTFGAILMPLSVFLWRRSKFTAAVGILCSTVITYASASSGPVLAYVAALVALLLWPARNHMRKIRWGIVIGLLAIQSVMNHPIWWLISRINVVGGSTGWYRYFLIDLFIKNFGDWWLLGTKNSAQWAYGSWDAANMYVDAGINGGLFALILLIVVIVRGFRSLGIARKAAEENASANAKQLWVLGCALFSTMMAFTDVAFFDQTVVLWYALLAMIVVVVNVSAQETAVPVPSLTQFQKPKMKEARDPVGINVRHRRFS
jgi:hypothetical protein